MPLTDKHHRPEHPTKEDWAPWDEWHQETTIESGKTVCRYWNSRYSVTVVREKQQLVRGARCETLLIISADQSADHDWRDFQRIKNELLGENWEGIELYPAERRKVDPSNAFVMFCFDKCLPIGVKDRDVVGGYAPQRPVNGEPYYAELSGLTE